MIAFLRDPSARLRLLASLVSGVLLALAFPALDLGPLALVALIPLLWAWRDATAARAAVYGFVFGLAFFGVLLYWLWYFGVAAIGLLVAACALYTALTGLLVGALGTRGIRSPFVIAAAWVVPEALRGQWPLGGFPWGELGAALHGVSWARTLASWGGTALVSFVVVVINAMLLDLALALRHRARRPSVLAVGGLAAVVVFVSVAVAARFEPTSTGHLRVAMLQGNDQNVDLTYAQQNAYLPQSHFRLADSLSGRYDLIVFPESSLGQLDPETDTALRDELVAVARAHDADVLANAAEEVPGPDDRATNTNLLYEPTGKLDGRYAKEHLVPFGEYVPWREHLRFIKALRQIPRDFKPGTKRVLFRVSGHPVGTIICFESAFATLTRDYARDGAQAIVVTTNNRSYRRSANSAQHVALSQMRAAETGRPVIHASVSGISAVIDAHGNARHRTRLFRNAVVSTTVTTTTGQTPYVRFGDWVLVASMLVLLGTAIAGQVRWWRNGFPRLAVTPGRRSGREP